MRRGDRIVRTLVCAVLAALATPLAAHALATGPDGATQLGPDAIVEVLCNGDCASLGVPDPPDGFEFEFGARLVRDGGHVDLSTEGNIFVRGPVRSDGDVHVIAGGALDFDGGTIVSPPRGPIGAGGSIDLSAGGDITLSAGSRVSIRDEPSARIFHSFERFDIPPDQTVRFLESPSLRVGSGRVVAGRGNAGSIILGSIESRLDGGGLIVLDGGLRVASAPVMNLDGITVSPQLATPPAQAQVPDGASPGDDLTWQITLGGDVYLDLSDFELGSLRLTSKKTIVFTDAPWEPVPEPGTALLLGLGLAALATTRRA